MDWDGFVQNLGTVAAIVLPLWNIPLILRMQKRRSSEDVSLWWCFGVLVCFLLMLPSGLVSEDPVYRIFSVCNITFFSVVVLQAFRFRSRK